MAVTIRAVSDDVLARARAHDRFDAELASVMGSVNASTAQLVDLVRCCVAERGWELEATTGPQHWVAVRCGVSPARAHRLVRIAERIEAFPLVAAEFAAGQLTEDHLDVIVSNAHPSHDPQLVSAGCWTINQLRRAIRALPTPEPEPDVVDDDDPDPEPEPQGEVVAGGWGDDGRHRGRWDVGSELGSLFERAMRSARNALYRDRSGTDADDDAQLADITSAAAFDRLLRAALDTLDPATAAGRRASERHQVLVHLDAEHPERSRINLGPILSSIDRRLLTCDADLRAVLYRGGRPVGLGRRHRVADPILRALIEDRDGGCRIDGCGRTAGLHIHHLVHWADGGPTDPTNLVALCGEHHRAVHQGRLRLVGDPTTPDGLVIVDRHGRPLPRPGPRRPPGTPIDAAPYRGPDRSEPFTLRWF